MVPLTGVEPALDGLAYHTYFHKPYISICCSLDYIITIAGVSRIVSEDPFRFPADCPSCFNKLGCSSIQ